MRDTVEALLKLQELELVLTESRILHQDSNQAELRSLEDEVCKRRIKIPAEHLRRYDLLRKNGIGAVRETAGVCNGCHLNIPQGDLNRMRRGQMPWVCPNCARFVLLTQ